MAACSVDATLGPASPASPACLLRGLEADCRVPFRASSLSAVWTCWMSTPPARAQACVAQVSTWACADQGQPRSPGRPLAHALGLATPACREQGARRPPGGTAGAGSWGAGRGGSRAGKPPSRGQNSSAVQAAICSWRRVTFLSAVTSLPRRHSFAFEVSLARPTRSLCECSSQGSHRPFTGNLRLKASRGRRPRTHLRTSPAMPVGLGDPLCSRSPQPAVPDPARG